MSYIDHITGFLFDENRRFSTKAAVVFFGLLFLIFTDSMFGFSYSYSVDRKIQQVEKLNAIIYNANSDSVAKKFAINQRNEVINRKSLLGIAANSIRQIKWGAKSNDNNQNPHYEIKPPEYVSRSRVLFHLSSSLLYYFIAIVSVPAILFTDKNTSIPQRLATGIFGAVVFWGLGLAFYWIFDLIPMISKKTWIWNYLLNFLLQFGLVFIAVKSSQKKN